MRMGWSGEASRAQFMKLTRACVVGDDLHGPAAQDVGGPHQHRVADLVGDLQGLLHAGGGAVGRLLELQFGQQLLEELAVLGPVDGRRPRSR